MIGVMVPNVFAADDITQPTVTVPSDISTTSTNPSGASVTFVVSATDDVGVTSGPTCIPASGTNFPVGTTTVTCTASDAAGNTGTASFTVTVTYTDVTKPIITLSDLKVDSDWPVMKKPPQVTISSCKEQLRKQGLKPITVDTISASYYCKDFADIVIPVFYAPSVHGLTFSFDVTATDDVGVTSGPTCIPASGTNFPVGTTTVTCKAYDAAGNEGTAIGTVTVELPSVIANDNTPPTVNVPVNKTVPAYSSSGVMVSFDVSATDDVSVFGPVFRHAGTEGPTCIPASGTNFPVGTTTVTCTASDAAGNTGTASFTVTVIIQNQEPRSPSLPVAPSEPETSSDTSQPVVLVPGDITIQTANQNGSSATFHSRAMDNVDGVIATTCDYSSGYVFPIGTTEVVCTATDSSGNTSSNSFNVTIEYTSPYDQNVLADRTVIVEIDASLPVGLYPYCASTEPPSCFHPNTVIIGLGDKITWKNYDSPQHHTVTSGDPSLLGKGGTLGNSRSGHFDSGLIYGEWTLQFKELSAGDELRKGVKEERIWMGYDAIQGNQYEMSRSVSVVPGTYPYFCTIHPWMTGTVIVKDGFIPPAEPTSTPAEPTSTPPPQYQQQIPEHLKPFSQTQQTPTITTSSDSSFKKYINYKNKFSIEYPNDWLKGAGGLAHKDALAAFSFSDNPATGGTIVQVFLQKEWKPYLGPPPLSDSKALQAIGKTQSEDCTGKCSNFRVVDSYITYTDDNRKVYLSEMTFSLEREESPFKHSINSILGYVFDGEHTWIMSSFSVGSANHIHFDEIIHMMKSFSLTSTAAAPEQQTQQQTQQSKGGGCLIATATFGSEMAPQVQFLRELRDNTVLQTESGTSFMTGFNQFYYSFSPYIADYERENPAFKETVKLALTPLLTSLTLLQYADIDSESEMLGYGIGVILLNIGMYFVAPAVLIMTVRKSFQRS
jgi:plastocyanin